MPDKNMGLKFCNLLVDFIPIFMQK